MLSAQRQKLILEYLTTRKLAQVVELSSAFDVSQATVRRDLMQMENEGIIRRIHGGALLIEDKTELPILHRSEQQAEHKRRIGEMAAKLVQDGDTIIISSGTTTEAMVPFLASKTDLTVITNAINVAYRLTRYPHIAVIILGGWLRHSECSMLGHLTEQALHDLQAHKIFHGVFGIDTKNGLTGTHLQEVQTDRRIIEAARELIVLADHSKFAQLGPIRLAPLSAVSTVVTDTDAPDRDVQALRTQGITVIQA